MTQTLLRIDSSAGGAGSRTRAALDTLIAATPHSQIVTRDLAAKPLPQITADWVAARSIPAEQHSERETDILALSDALIDELRRADHLLIGLPVYNFGMPAALKAWIDLIARPRVTFRYTADGPQGLLTDISATIVTASGGTAIDSPTDFATPHLRHVLRFVGITDVKVVSAADVLLQKAA